MIAHRWLLLAVCTIVSCQVAVAEDVPDMKLSPWDRGLSVDSIAQQDMRVYLWFYEWHMFDAVTRGQHTRGAWENRVTVSDDRSRGKIVSQNPGISVEMKAVDDGAEMLLTVTNRSDHDWPALASMIACFNPGPAPTRNRQFANTNTFFNSAAGLKPLKMKAPREIHYNHRLRKAIDAEADEDGKYVWSSKWPKSDVDAVDGLIIRESTDGRWVTGIAWERFLSAQGHNPWECMHLSIHVGPLAKGETRKVRGRIYLFRGDKEELFKRYEKEFGRNEK